MSSQHYTQRLFDLTRDCVMTHTKVRSEDRKHKRFRAREGVFVMLKPSNTHMGRLVDINMSGLALEYIDIDEPVIKPVELEIFVANSPFRMNLSCETIYDLTIYESPLSSWNKKRCGVEFGELTPDQTSQLEYFIDHHTTGEV
jgi:hypothetical protein